MIPADLKAARSRLGLTQKSLAGALSEIRRKWGYGPVSVRTVQHWEQGAPRHPIPVWVPLALEKLVIRP